MISDFAARFDSYYSARYDLRLYNEAKGYRSEGDYTVWEPLHEMDVEQPQQFAPGAMAVGEIETYYYDADDEF